MREPKYKIGDVLKCESRDGTVIFEVGQVVNWVKTFNYNETDLIDLWAYGPVGMKPTKCTFERFLTKVSKLEKSLL